MVVKERGRLLVHGTIGRDGKCTAPESERDQRLRTAAAFADVTCEVLSSLDHHLLHELA
jgi:hypothetical protein